MNGENAKREPKFILFIVVFLGLCLVPLLGMIWSDPVVSSDEDSLASFPGTSDDDGSLNISYLSDLGDYFEDHFAYRNILIDADARLKSEVLSTSPNNQVIVGSEGWLFFKGSLADFTNSNPLSDREVVNIAHNLTLMQGYTQAQDAEFIFTIAPNKNTLYPDHMPYYFPESNNDSMDRLKVALDEANINYLDLFEVFASQEKELYFKTDSHWNSEGALLVSNELLDHMGLDEVAVKGEEEVEFVGDIEKMLYPISAQSEGAISYVTDEWSYESKAQSAEDSLIETQSSGESTLYMYRDSFANNLIPLLSPTFETAHYSKLIPYNLTEVVTKGADYVVVERAQRHVRLLSEDPPFMPAPKTSIEVEDFSESDSALGYRIDGDFAVLEGYIEESLLSENDDIYVLIKDASGSQLAYVPFYTTFDNYEFVDIKGSGKTISTDFGFRMFLPKSDFSKSERTVSIVVSKEGGKISSIAEYEIKSG